MRTDAEIRTAGMTALLNALGPVEAERFVASVSRDRFDYTLWRRAHLPEISVAELSKAAKAFAAAG